MMNNADTIIPCNKKVEIIWMNAGGVTDNRKL